VHGGGGERKGLKRKLGKRKEKTEASLFLMYSFIPFLRHLRRAMGEGRELNSFHRLNPHFWLSPHHH